MITVFTPTYNRGYIIDTLYQSLLRQTSKDFEWIVVDDGSTDDTEKYFRELLSRDNPFPVIYQKQTNGGKHRAINRGLQLAQGDLFFIVDSDDYLTDDAVGTLISWYKAIESNERIVAVSGLKANIVSNNAIGGIPKVKEKQGYIDAKNNHRKKFGLLGDKAEAYKTDILKKNLFKEFDGENFLSEDTVWNSLALQGYYVRWYSKIIYYCEYLHDGLTKNLDGKLIANFEGYTYAVKIRMRCKSCLERLNCVAVYYAVAKQKGLSLKETAKRIECSAFTVWLGKTLRGLVKR